MADFKSSNIPVKRSDIPGVVTFASCSAMVSKNYAELLQDVAQYLKQHPELGAQVLGYTDHVEADQGDPYYLSGNRAQSVVNFLISRDVSPDRLVSEGRGVSTTYAALAANRRAEVYLRAVGQ